MFYCHGKAFIRIFGKMNYVIDYNFNVLYPFRDKNFPLWVNLKDTRFDKSVLGSIEFENIIRGRWHSLLAMFNYNTDDLTLIEETIDKIINLTEPYTKQPK